MDTDQKLDLILNPNIVIKKNGNIIIENIRNVATRVDHKCVVINFNDNSFIILTKEEFNKLLKNG